MRQRLIVDCLEVAALAIAVVAMGLGTVLLYHLVKLMVTP